MPMMLLIQLRVVDLSSACQPACLSFQANPSDIAPPPSVADQNEFCLPESLGTDPVRLLRSFTNLLDRCAARICLFVPSPIDSFVVACYAIVAVCPLFVCLFVCDVGIHRRPITITVTRFHCLLINVYNHSDESVTRRSGKRRDCTLDKQDRNDSLGSHLFHVYLVHQFKLSINVSIRSRTVCDIAAFPIGLLPCLKTRFTNVVSLSL